MRYFLFLSYRGTNYHGWQIQKNAVGVQEVLNDSLSTVLREKVNTIGSGRTDTGVHAHQQVVHFDIEKKLEPRDFVYKMNSILPKDIACHDLRVVKNDAHARFSAIERKYEYHITSQKDPFLEDLAYYFRKDLNYRLMNELNNFIISCEDFQAFSRVKTDVNDFLCDVKSVKWENGGNRSKFSIVANRFLRGMVRAMVGSMIEVGLGNWTKQKFMNVVHEKDRRLAGSAVPAHGLFLTSVKYPDDIFAK